MAPVKEHAGERSEEVLASIDARHLRALTGAMVALIRERPSFTTAAARVFLEVCLREGSSLREICESTEMPQSTVSRQLLDLSEQTRTGDPGAGLITWAYEQNLRTKAYRLSERGRQLRDKVLGQMRDEETHDDAQ